MKFKIFKRFYINFFVFVSITFVIFIFAGHKGSALLDTNKLFKSIVFIGHINLDKTMDTVIAIAGRDRKFKPQFITWGHDPTSTIPDSLKVPMTTIIYPSWSKFKIGRAHV